MHTLIRTIIAVKNNRNKARRRKERPSRQRRKIYNIMQKILARSSIDRSLFFEKLTNRAK